MAHTEGSELIKDTPSPPCMKKRPTRAFFYARKKRGFEPEKRGESDRQDGGNAAERRTRESGTPSMLRP